MKYLIHGSGQLLIHGSDQIRIHGSGQVFIDTVPPVGQESAKRSDNGTSSESGPTAIDPDETSPGIDITRVNSAEEELFLSLLGLLRRNYLETNTLPGRKALRAAIELLTELCERGTIPESDRSDKAFIARLIALVERLADSAPGPFLATISAELRELLLDDEPAPPNGERVPGARSTIERIPAEEPDGDGDDGSDDEGDGERDS